MPGTVLQFVASGATSKLGEKVSPGALISGGLVLVGAGLALMTLGQADSSWTITLPGTVLAMVGTGLFNPAVSGVALGSVPERQSGLAAGVNDTFRQAGIAVGVAALGALIPTGAALSGADPVGYVNGLHDALWVCVGLCAAGAVACFALLRSRSAAPVGELALDAA
jgi:dipeptide/tripeptide permease